MARRLVGWMLGGLVRAWLATCRIELLDPEPPRTSLAIAFWHGQQMLLASVARRRRRLVTLVSLSRDGELQTGVMTALGVKVKRGSSSRAGASGLRGLIRLLRGGFDVAIAADGPRGPAERAKPGVALAALAGRADLVAVAAACEHGWRLRSWDAFELPRPFSRIVVTIARLPERSGTEHVERELAKLTERARAACGNRGTDRLVGQSVAAQNSQSRETHVHTSDDQR